jgi:GntR family transcriptional regulator / MocR family aminotransferase
MLLDGQGPLCAQVYRGLRNAIVQGDFAPGTRLPATRDVAVDLRISRSTVLLAYEQLVAEGYAVGRRGSGTYVADTPAQPALVRAVAPAADRTPRLSRLGAGLVGERRLPLESGYIGARRTHRWDFRYGMPSLAEFPLDAWHRSLGRTARRAAHRAYDYGSPQGSPALRAALATYLGQARGVRCSPDHIVIVSGSQQALDLTARVLLDRGDRVAVEEPGYEGARQAFRAVGARLVPAPVDAEGLDPATLPPARLAFVTPSHQYPLGGVLSWPRRSALLAWASRHQAWVVEDDYDGEYRFDGPPIPPLKALDSDARVLYVGTFSKVMFPSLRIGYLVCPPGLVDAFARMRLVADGGGPQLEQEALADFIARGTFARHVRRSRHRSGERRRMLVDALNEALGDRLVVSGANAGLHVAVWLPGVPAREAVPIARRASAAGIGIYPIAPYYLIPPRHEGFILGYGALPVAEIRTGVKRLAGVFAGSA